MMKVIELNKLTEFFSDLQIDYFICSASFESRSFAFAENLRGINVSNAMIFSNVDSDPKIIANRDSIIKIFAEKTEVKTVDLQINNPTFSFISIAKACNDIFEGSNKYILVDISTFTHESLLMLLRVLVEHKRVKDKIILSYVGATDYSSDTPNIHDKWLTKGVKDIRSVIGYPGYYDPAKKNHLIILFGFEKERTARLIDKFEYDKVSLAFGSKSGSINEKFQSINEERHHQLLNLYSNANSFEISLVDPLNTKDEILSYISQFKECNIVIAPMNNKLSTVGAGLAALENKDIQLCYMQANIYNIENYAEASNDCYIVDL
jgi:hypothetical protein